VAFVFREPNMGGAPYEMDMRAQLNDPQFRAFRNGTFGRPASIRGWWNCKVGALAHAVVNALNDERPQKAFVRFQSLIECRHRNHDFLHRFAFMQIKKVGGAGTSKSAEIERHAIDYSQYLKRQIVVYRPHLIIGCGRPPASPARLLNQYVLPAGQEHRTHDGRWTWWRYGLSGRPMAMLEFRHPSRGSSEDKYCSLLSAVREVTAMVR